MVLQINTKMQDNRIRFRRQGETGSQSQTALISNVANNTDGEDRPFLVGMYGDDECSMFNADGSLNQKCLAQTKTEDGMCVVKRGRDEERAVVSCARLSSVRDSEKDKILGIREKTCRLFNEDKTLNKDCAIKSKVCFKDARAGLPHQKCCEVDEMGRFSELNYKNCICSKVENASEPICQREEAKLLKISSCPLRTQMDGGRMRTKPDYKCLCSNPENSWYHRCSLPASDQNRRLAQITGDGNLMAAIIDKQQKLTLDGNDSCTRPFDQKTAEKLCGVGKPVGAYNSTFETDRLDAPAIRQDCVQIMRDERAQLCCEGLPQKDSRGQTFYRVPKDHGYRSPGCLQKQAKFEDIGFVGETERDVLGIFNTATEQASPAPPSVTGMTVAEALEASARQQQKFDNAAAKLKELEAQAAKLRAEQEKLRAQLGKE